MDIRGQSEVVGVVLLLGLVVTAAGGIVVLGSEAVTDTRNTATAGAARHAMTQFDSQASLVAHGGSDAQRTRFAGARSAERRVEPDSGWMNITIRNETDDTLEEPVANVSLGAVVYENGDTTIAYQGGGVWQTFENGSGMVSPPEFHYRGTTLTLPLVVVGDGERRLSERVRLSKAGEDRDVYPNASEGYANPLTEGKVVVTVHSEYYDAWARFFAERTAGQASVDHRNETATIVLVTPISHDESVSTALRSNAAGDEIELSGAGNNGAFVDSYNSSNGNYSVSQTNNGTILTSGGVEMSGNSKVVGNLRSGGTVTLSGTSNVTRKVEWTTGFSAKGSTEYGSEEQIDGVPRGKDISGFVLNRLDEIEKTNDNEFADAIDGERLNFSGGNTVTLDADDGKQYYLRQVDMSGTELVVETRGKEVEIAVGDDFAIDDADVRVKGAGTVRFYVADDARLDDGSTVSVPGDHSERLWLYGTPDTDVDISGSSGNPVEFVGVVYATGGDADDNSFQIDHADLYGGVVAGEVQVNVGGAVHYDEALLDERILPANAELPRVTYLHVSVSEIRVEDA